MCHTALEEHAELADGKQAVEVRPGVTPSRQRCGARRKAEAPRQ